MTVQELINWLETIEDKDMEVFVEKGNLIEPVVGPKAWSAEVNEDDDAVLTNHYDHDVEDVLVIR